MRQNCVKYPNRSRRTAIIVDETFSVLKPLARFPAFFPQVGIIWSQLSAQCRGPDKARIKTDGVREPTPLVPPTACGSVFVEREFPLHPCNMLIKNVSYCPLWLRAAKKDEAPPRTDKLSLSSSVKSIQAVTIEYFTL